MVCALHIAASFAQNVDKADMECLYRLSFLKDTTTDVATEDLMVLRLNKDRSIFYSYNSYSLDSLMCSDQGPAVQMDFLANGPGKYGKIIVSYTVVKDLKTKQIDYADCVGGDYYKYQEELPAFHWTIVNEKKKIWDYTCQKAVCQFRGRSYEAWFTSEIPVNDGPWKFCGLPGLILEVHDTKNQYSFEFVGLRKSNANIAELPHQYTKVSREKYNKIYKNYIKDPIAFMSASSGIKVTLVKSTSKNPQAVKNVNYDMMERY